MLYITCFNPQACMCRLLKTLRWLCSLERVLHCAVRVLCSAGCVDLGPAAQTTPSVFDLRTWQCMCSMSRSIETGSALRRNNVSSCLLHRGCCRQALSALSACQANRTFVLGPPQKSIIACTFCTSIWHLVAVWLVLVFLGLGGVGERGGGGACLGTCLLACWLAGLLACWLTGWPACSWGFHQLATLPIAWKLISCQLKGWRCHERQMVLFTAEVGWLLFQSMCRSWETLSEAQA